MTDSFHELSATIAETSPEPQLRLDSGLRIVDANQPFYSSFQISAQEIYQRTLYELGNGQWAVPRLRLALERVLNDDSTVDDLEITLDLPNIGERTLRVRARRSSTEGSGERTVLIAFEDVTERKRVEKALQESEIKYRGVFEAAHDLIVLVDREGNILDINRRAEALLGYNKEEMRQMNTFAHCYVPEDRPLMRQVIDEVMEGGTCDCEVRWLAKDEHIVYFDGAFAPHLSAEGEFLAAICTLRDVTKLRRMQQTLTRNEQRFHLLIENSLDGIVLSSAIGIVLYLSPAVNRILGYEIEELLHNNRFDLIHPEDIEQARQHWDELLQQPGKIVACEYRFRHKDGSWRWIECLSCNKLDDPSIEAIIGNYRDITERVGIEAELMSAELLRIEIAKEKEIVELRERFISMVSHDFRTPLTVIQASSHLLGQYSERLSPEKRLKHLNDIEMQIKFMVEMLDDLLLADRGRSGKVNPELAPLNVPSFCQQILEQFQLTDQGAHQFVYEGKLENIQTDENLLRRILVNLLSNAIKYSPNGGAIHLEVATQDGEAIFRIGDQGIGIPAEDQERLFEPFHRARNTGKIRGTGLGLSIVKSNVEALGGTITCESNEGKGTTFIVRLPANPVSPS